MASINEALDRIIKYGTPLQRQTSANLKSSGIKLEIRNPGSDAATLVTNSKETQQKINTVVMNEMQALSELSIRVNPNQLTSETAMERNMVHEGRHSYHLARVVSEYSQAHLRKQKPYNPAIFTVEFAAYQAYADYVIQAVKLNHPLKQQLIDDSMSAEWNMTKWVGKKLVSNTAGIYAYILKKYNLDGKSAPGEPLGDYFWLTPRSA